MFGFRGHPHHGHRHGHHARSEHCGDRERHAGPRRGGFGRDDGPGGWENNEGSGRGGRRRMFDGGELRLVLLKLIADKPRHGYDLIRAIEELTGGAYAPSPGIVYPTLTLLSDMGLIEEQSSDNARKQFAITPDGTAHVAEHANEIAAMIGRLETLGAMRERTGAVPVRRAMHNLKSVLLARLGEGLNKDKQLEAAALIDEAARKIERL